MAQRTKRDIAIDAAIAKARRNGSWDAVGEAVDAHLGSGQIKESDRIAALTEWRSVIIYVMLAKALPYGLNTKRGLLAMDRAHYEVRQSVYRDHGMAVVLPHRCG